MEAEITFSVLRSPEGGYEARAVGHSIFTQAETLEELREMAQDAVRCHFDSDPPVALVLQEEDPCSSA